MQIFFVFFSRVFRGSVAGLSRVFRSSLSCPAYPSAAFRATYTACIVKSLESAKNTTRNDSKYTKILRKVYFLRYFWHNYLCI